MKKLILAGGGHGHINILKLLAKEPVADLEITLITNFGRQYYSGMLPGFIEGIYTEDKISFDVEELCREAGVTYVNDKIKEVDGERQLVITEEAKYPYDFLSMNLGLASREDFRINPENSTYVKPISSLVNFTYNLENSQDDEGKKMIIAGAGVSGIELALAYKNRFPHLNITILGKGEKFLPNFNSNFREKIKSLIKDRSIKLSLDSELLDVKESHVKTNKGELEYDYLILANGYKGVDILYKAFEVTEENYILVDDYLTANEKSLAMGDMISLKSHRNLVKAGVFAIRQAPVLYNNLLAMLEGRRNFQAYKPQSKYLQIVNVGNKKALMGRGSFCFYGRLPWMIKDYIDRKYMGKG
ncbi:MAG: FAD-dependent oxidoreductase [Tissierellia bacterium]|nr:FAD-dependent oxidoreductase [Tissierellia bacterium]NLM06908.1 FAD-dependent oxidoreductase [Tissierellia bacterium]